MLADDLTELFESGVSILVGTRDASFVPEAMRGCGAIVHPDRRHITVFLPTSVSERTVANLRDNAQVAVAFSRVLDHASIQVKGRVEDIRPATETDRDVIARYHVAFAEMIYMAGIPRARTRTMNVWPSVAITFEVTDIFEQTPGPRAGERLGSRPGSQVSGRPRVESNRASS
jgi:hypothetical protein